MNISVPKLVGTIVASAFAVLCFGLLWEINHLLLARLDGPSFSTDQMIASLGVMVTGLGLFIAMAAVGIAVLAVLGFSELRTTIERNVKEEFRLSEERLKSEALRLPVKRCFRAIRTRMRKLLI
jgi:hypothetical protein